MTYGMNNYTFSVGTRFGFQNTTSIINIKARNDKEAFTILADNIHDKDTVIAFTKKPCASTIALVREYLNYSYTDCNNKTLGVLEDANILLRATPKWWENLIIEYFELDLGVGDNTTCLDEPITYEMLDDILTDFIIDKCVHFFHAEDRVFCMIDFTLINDGSCFVFPDGESIASTVIDGWCWESECDTDADFLDFFGNKIRATINAFLARLRG